MSWMNWWEKRSRQPSPRIASREKRRRSLSSHSELLHPRPLPNSHSEPLHPRPLLSNHSEPLPLSLLRISQVHQVTQPLTYRYQSYSSKLLLDSWVSHQSLGGAWERVALCDHNFALPLCRQKMISYRYEWNVSLSKHFLLIKAVPRSSV